MVSDDAAASGSTGPPEEPPASAAPDGSSVSQPGAVAHRLVSAGRVAWAIVGLAAVVVLLALLVARLSLVVVPVVLALFPATLLSPVATWCKQRMPDALAAALALLAGLVVIGLVIGLMVPLVVAELPGLTDAAAAGIRDVARLLDEGLLGLEFGGVAGLLDAAGERVGELTGPALQAATAAVEFLVAAVLLVVVLFFLLKDGERIAGGLLAAAPEGSRARLRQVGGQAWGTLGAFFRGQLLIALVDAVAIGIGLALLRVPLALPLAVLVFFGGLFPIVGAVTAGAVAVLVALADGGIGLAVAVLVLIVAVQQLEGNVLEPLILGHVVRLHPLVVVLAVAAGAITLGVLGAFLAVPATAVVGHVVRAWRDGAGATAGAQAP
jgi:putative heme transporter